MVQSQYHFKHSHKSGKYSAKQAKQHQEKSIIPVVRIFAVKATISPQDTSNIFKIFYHKLQTSNIDSSISDIISSLSKKNKPTWTIQTCSGFQCSHPWSRHLEKSHSAGVPLNLRLRTLITLDREDVFWQMTNKVSFCLRSHALSSKWLIRSLEHLETNISTSLLEAFDNWLVSKHGL